MTRVEKKRSHWRNWLGSLTIAMTLAVFIRVFFVAPYLVNASTEATQWDGYHLTVGDHILIRRTWDWKDARRLGKPVLVFWPPQRLRWFK